MTGKEGNNSEEAKNTRTIAVDLVARVEGEGALRVTVKDGTVQDVELRIFEPPRFFEAFLQGRHYSEVPDIVARICGICPVAYQMSAVHAIEQIFGLQVDGALASLPAMLASLDPRASSSTTAKAAEQQGELKIELPTRREAPKVGRNDPCPCGSGKKYKACCGRSA